MILDAVADFCTETKRIWQLIGNVIKLLQYAIPILLVLLGSLDLGKAAIAGDEKEIKEAQKMLIKRIVYGVVIFFAFIIVKGVFGLIGEQSATNSKCFECVEKPSSC